MHSRFAAAAPFRVHALVLMLGLALGPVALAQAPSPAEPDKLVEAAPAQAKPPAPAPAAPAPAAPAAPATPPAATPPAALPKELAPELKVSLSPTQNVAVGDVVTLKLEAVAPAGVDVAVPEQSLAPFEMLDRRARTEPAGDKQRFMFEIDLLALDAGSLTVPGLRVRVVGPKGELGETTTAPQAVQVKSLIGNEPNAEPKAASEPVVVIQDDYTLAWVGGGVLAIALIALITLLVSRWLSRRPKALPPAPPPRPAWELALEKLEQLKRRQESLLAAERSEEFIEGVSSALREYLGRRYGFDGLESTTDEILRTLEKVRPHKLSLSGVSLLLEQCDLVKFARMKPDATQCDDLWNGATGLVRATTPQPMPAAEARPSEARP